MLLVSLSHAVNHLNGTAITFLVSLIIASEFGLSNTEVGFVAAAATLTSGYLQIFFSALGRYCAMKLLLAVGNALMGFATVLVGLSSNFQALFASRLVWGTGSAAQHPIGTSLISNNFQGKLRGRALGTHLSLAYVGNVLGPPFVFALSGIVGWRVTLFALAALTVSTTVPLLIGIKERSEDTEDQGSRSLRTRDSIFRAAKDRNVLLITLTQVVLAGGRGLGVIMVFLPLLLIREVGLDSAVVSYIYMPLYLVGGFFGPILYGWLSDRWARKPVTILIIVLVGILTYTVPTLRDPTAIAVTLFALGSISLSISSLLQTYLADVTDPSIRDMAFGLYFTKGFGFGTVWLIVVGAAIDLFGFGTAFKLMAISSVPAVALCLFVSPEKALPGDRE